MPKGVFPASPYFQKQQVHAPLSIHPHPHSIKEARHERKEPIPTKCQTSTQNANHKPNTLTLNPNSQPTPNLKLPKHSATQECQEIKEPQWVSILRPTQIESARNVQLLIQIPQTCISIWRFQLVFDPCATPVCMMTRSLSSFGFADQISGTSLVLQCRIVARKKSPRAVRPSKHRRISTLMTYLQDYHSGFLTNGRHTMMPARIPTRAHQFPGQDLEKAEPCCV